MPTNRVTEILNGSRGISADSALRLARYFGISARFWMKVHPSDLKAGPESLPSRRRAADWKSALRGGTGLMRPVYADWLSASGRAWP
nr:hypothetical protein [Thiohalocapsa halophila]